VPGRDVSVILIVRNGAAYIAGALESVFLSTIQPLEILVIDGGSTDRTAEIASGFHLVRVIAQQSSGVTEAYNEGIAHARGDLVAFISHDDRWLPGKLDRQVGIMRERPELLFTVTHAQHVLDAGAAPPPGFRVELLERPVPGLIMETLVARREAFDVVGLLDPAFDTGSDTDWFARALDAGVPMAVLPDTLLEKRIHDRNTSLNNPRINELLLRALRGSIARKREAAARG
jgi:glycosyltransferase involved in cell wall biosynthesis